MRAATGEPVFAAQSKHNQYREDNTENDDNYSFLGVLSPVYFRAEMICIGYGTGQKVDSSTCSAGS